MRTLHPIIGVNLGEKGKVTRRTGSKMQLFEMGSGHYNIVPAGTELQSIWHNRMCIALLFIDETYVQSQVALDSATEIRLPLCVNSFDPQVLTYVEKLIDELKSPSALSGVKAQAWIDLLLARLLELHAGGSKRGDEKRAEPSKAFVELVDYIENNLALELSVPELSSRCKLSTFHFIRQFKRTFLMTPHEYILQRRMERAKIMLQIEEYSIGEVARMVGFVDSGHFSKAFKQRCGMSPTQFRKRGL